MYVHKLYICEYVCIEYIVLVLELWGSQKNYTTTMVFNDEIKYLDLWNYLLSLVCKLSTFLFQGSSANKTTEKKVIFFLKGNILIPKLKL